MLFLERPFCEQRCCLDYDRMLVRIKDQEIETSNASLKNWSDSLGGVIAEKVSSVSSEQDEQLKTLVENAKKTDPTLEVIHATEYETKTKQIRT